MGPSAPQVTTLVVSWVGKLQALLMGNSFGNPGALHQSQDNSMESPTISNALSDGSTKTQETAPLVSEKASVSVKVLALERIPAPEASETINGGTQACEQAPIKKGCQPDIENKTKKPPPANEGAQSKPGTKTNEPASVNEGRQPKPMTSPTTKEGHTFKDTNCDDNATQVNGNAGPEEELSHMNNTYTSASAKGASVQLNGNVSHEVIDTIFGREQGSYSRKTG
ncbi:hypothetical protein FGG08_005992 [Glutinoglossum americanum]|uniref:Uncharacterized protein n=1 Tax=Glutinoglossum americanum TaxID=1670608 RepID=A0A9P8HWZ7_9PEZI|nr:hypothetical protein FGG08_005992 [Glutinoglossum americanum]